MYKNLNAGDKKIAVALSYKPETAEDAPKVTASGRGDMASRMVEFAKELGVPVVEDSDLAQLLSTVDAGLEIPTESFFAVAEILRYVYEVTSKSMPVVPESKPG